MKVSVLGPEGTYSVHAAKELAPEAKLVLAGSKLGAINMVAEGTSERGVVPIENSIGGIVLPALDGLFKHNLTVIGERVLGIHHTLAGLQVPERPDDIKKILSHPQGLTQCAHYLETHFPEAEQVEMDSTAQGMQVIAETHDGEALAIGPDPAAEIYGLVAIDRAIEDEPGNETHFVAFSRDKEGAAEQDFVMMAIVPEEDREGLLHDITGVIHEQGVNLSALHSRSRRGEKLGTYMFYVRLDMKSTDSRYSALAAEIEAHGNTVVRMSA